MDNVTTGFLQPKRRLTRQRSGFNVSGIKTGSECVISTTKIFKVNTNELTFTNKDSNVLFTKLFGKDIGIFGAGGYLRSNSEVTLTLQINLSQNGKDVKKSLKTYKISPNHWTRVGDDVQIEVDDIGRVYNSSADIHIEALTGSFEIEIYDLYSGVVKYFAEKPTYFDAFYEKTDLYRPDIYYLTSNEYIFDKANVDQSTSGYIVCKSCNRCARFLPIDIEDEGNSLGFSNHCKKKAPCVHNAFSRYTIENVENINLLPEEFRKNILEQGDKKYLRTHFGFQLECRTCKKFEVNSPLNPLRNKAQHHEDGARRRAFERLIIELTKKDFVKNFRVKNGQEFQEYVWNNFSRTCFGCGKKLDEITDMDIDHTLPLVYLWPLDASATALCQTCNSLKHDLFPSEFKLYNKDKLEKLSKLTGIPSKVLNSKERIVNETVVNLLVANAEWLFDDFLARKDYQKIKNGKKVSDLIYKALNKILTTLDIDLVAIYKKETNRIPTTVTLG